MAVIPPVNGFLGAAAVTSRAPVAPHQGSSMTAGRPVAAGKSAEAFRQFEAFVLQSFIETMLPKNAESVFGKGTAGGIWKSMLAEKLADQISRNGGVGIAQRIAASPATHAPPASGETTVHSAPIAALAGISHQSIAKPGDDV